MKFLLLTKDKCRLRYKKNFAKKFSITINCLKVRKPTNLIEKIFVIQRTVHRDIFL